MITSRRLGQAGSRLSAEIPDMVHRYHRSLLAIGNPLGTTPELWAESSTHAAMLLSSCAQVIDLPADAVEDEDFGADLTVSAMLGSLWACCQARLTDSLRAMEILSRIAVDTVVGILSEAPVERRGELIAHAVRVINRIAGLHIRAAAFSYDAYLLRQIEEANVGDRRRLARDIHDHLGSTLVLAFRQLELYRRKVGPVEAGERHLAAIERSLQEATDVTRGLISGLRAESPPASLGESLNGSAEALNINGLPVHIAVNGDETWLPDHYRAELFLVLREFLRNSFTHAAPDTITIRVGISPHRVDVEALDDGIGFDPSAPGTGRRGGGTGLAAMRERVEHLGGHFALTSAPGRGTCMRLWISMAKRPRGRHIED